MDKKRTVLFIDDDADLCNMMNTHLSFIGRYNVVTANDGKEGLRLAREVRPDIIILDVLMPGLDGFAVLERLKKDDKTDAIPVIMLSGLDDEKAKMKGSRLYDEEYLIKPIDIYALKSKIEEIFKIRGL